MPSIPASTPASAATPPIDCGTAYTLDTQSNRLSYWSGGGSSRSFGFDALGNVASETRSDGSRNYGYDPFNRLSAAHINGTYIGDYRNALNQRAYRGTLTSNSRYGYGPRGD